MVLATFSKRCHARIDSPKRVNVSSSHPASSLLSEQNCRIPALSSRAFSLFWRVYCRARAATARSRTFAELTRYARLPEQARRRKGDFERQIETVEEWAGKLSQIAQRLLWRTAVMVALIMPRGAGVHRSDQLKLRRIAYFGPRARDMYFTRFNRFSQCIQHATLKLRQLIKKQNAIVCQ